MKIIIDIPQVFEKRFNEDRFKDSLERIECDVRDCINEDHTIPTISGLWELELIDMLIEAFKAAEVREEVASPKSNPYPSFFAEDYIDPR